MRSCQRSPNGNGPHLISVRQTDSPDAHVRRSVERQGHGSPRPYPARDSVADASPVTEHTRSSGSEPKPHGRRNRATPLQRRGLHQLPAQPRPGDGRGRTAVHRRRIQRARRHRGLRTRGLAGGRRRQPGRAERPLPGATRQPARSTGAGDLQRRTERQSLRHDRTGVHAPARRTGRHLACLPGHGARPRPASRHDRHPADDRARFAELGPHV